VPDEPTLPIALNSGNGPPGPTWCRAVVGAVVLGAVVLGWAVRRTEVVGPSMLPTLDPGDRVLVVRLPRWWPLAPGHLVAVPDPRLPSRLLVKRVTAVSDGSIEVGGDNEGSSTDSRHFGPVPRRRVVGRVLYRYAPAGRTGRL
jgi:nickel-type superoxide dismutase maturation protease